MTYDSNQEQNLRADYTRLRTELEVLAAAPVKDEARISALIDTLEKLQLALKAENGILGNNPNE